MNNPKNSKLFLLLGILIGVSSTIFLILYQLANKNKKSVSSVVNKYIKISSDDISTELEIVENEQIQSEIAKDNLKEIKGIGPAIESLLNENNIYTFSDLSSTTIEELKTILDRKNLRIADPQTWPFQAQQVVKNKNN
jgi:predicted flap endonuclease-1-like 5' DNA nuclease